MTALVGEGELILVGALAIGADPDTVVDQVDVAALAHVIAAIERSRTPVEAAAAALVGVARRAPFPTGNLAAGWLAAVHVLAISGLEVRLGDATVVDLVTRVGTGQADEASVRLELAERVDRRETVMRRALRWLWSPRDDGPDNRTWTCPVCARPLPVSGGDADRLRGLQPTDARVELRARCARERRAQAAEVADTAVPTTWCPVVMGPDVAGRRAFLAIGNEAALAFIPTHSPRYEVVRLVDFEASDLIGDWNGLVGHGDRLTEVDDDTIRFDAAGLTVDLAPVVRALVNA